MPAHQAKRRTLASADRLRAEDFAGIQAAARLRSIRASPLPIYGDVTLGTRRPHPRRVYATPRERLDKPLYSLRACRFRGHRSAATDYRRPTLLSVLTRERTALS